jgi:hypothetical protein
MPTDKVITREQTMATFPTITLNGGTTTTWTNQGGNITNHEVFAFTLRNTSPTNGTGVLLSNVTVFIDPTRYQCTVAVKGPQAVTGNFESNGV